jgi:glycosyltransferase involved in cell wall biosynthesis
LEGAGLLVKPGSVSALGQAIAHVLQHPDEVQPMRDAAATLQSRYYWDVLVHEFEHVYGEVG